MNDRERILLLTIDYAPQTGGVPHLLESIVEASSDTVEWRVVTLAQGTDEHRCCRVVRASSMRRLVIAAVSHVRWLRARPGSLIVSAHPYLGPIAHAVGGLARRRVSSLSYGRELVPETRLHRLALRSLRRDHRAVTISRHSASKLISLGVDESRTAWVASALTPVTREGPPQRRCSPGGLHLVTISRLAEGYKNLEVTLRAVAVLAASGRVRRYTIIGDGPRRDAIAAHARHLGIEHIVDLPGRLDDEDVHTTVASADVGLFASRDAVAEGGFEGFGIAIHELAAAGLPVVVGRAAGAIDAVEPEWATLVDPDDLRDWVHAVAEFSDDEGLRHRRAMAAHAFGMTLDTGATARRYVAALTGDTTDVRQLGQVA